MKKLNQKGFSHWLMPLLVIGVITVIGTYVMKGSHADSPPINYSATTGTFDNKLITVSPTSGVLNFAHGNHNTSVIPAGPTFNPLNLYQVGFTITDKTALQYRLDTFNSDVQGGFLNGSGSLTAGQATKVIAYVGPDTTNGTYHFSAQLSYLVPKEKAPHWRKGPLLSYTINVTGTPYLDYINVKPLNIAESLSRAKVNPSSGLIMGQAIYLSAEGHTSFQVRYNQPTQGQGFYESSGGLFPRQMVLIQSYINPSSKPNGIYDGSATLQYTNDLGQWKDGPLLTYHINLTD